MPGALEGVRVLDLTNHGCRSGSGDDARRPRCRGDQGRVARRRPDASSDPSAIQKLAPMLGADNAAILSELGFTADDIASLETDRVLHSPTPRKGP